MNGVEFTKQLSKTRENNNDTIRKNNEANEKRLADAKARNELAESKQLDGYIEDKADLEKNYQKNLNQLNDKTSRTLNENQDDYNYRVKAERDSFAKDAESKRKNFDKRFTDIKSSYRKSFESEKDFNKDIQDNQKMRYNHNLTANKKDATQQLKTYRERMSNSSEKLKEQYNNERQQLVNVQEDHVKDLHGDASKKQLELREKVSKDMQSSKAAALADAQTSKTYSDEQLENMQTNSQTRYNKLIHENSQSNADLVETQQRENLKTNRENQEHLLSVSRKFDGKVRAMENEKRRQDNGSGEFAEVLNSQKGLNEKTQNDNLVRSLRSKLVNAQSTYQDRATTEQTSFNDTLKRENFENASRTERKVNEANADKLSRVAHEREKNTRQLDNVTNTARDERATSDQQVMHERKNANERLGKLKENFNNSMKLLEEKNKQALDDVTNVANDDKSEFMKKVNEARKQELFTMKREFGKMMDSTIEDYEKRLGNYQRDNDSLQFTMDQKLQYMVDQDEKDSQLMSKNYADRRSADLKGQALLMDQKLFEFKTNMAQTTNDFQKKLDKLQATSDTKLKLLTSDYENKLKELRATTSNELGKRDMDRQVEQSRLKQAFEAEKIRMVEGYENKINEMKVAQDNQLKAAKEYKRLT